MKVQQWDEVNPPSTAPSNFMRMRGCRQGMMRAKTGLPDRPTSLPVSGIIRPANPGGC